LQPVINATGVILQHQSGPRALPETVVDEFRRVPRNTAILNTISKLARAGNAMCTLLNVEALDRSGSGHCGEQIAAAAVLVTLAALARGGEVIVSRES